MSKPLKIFVTYAHKDKVAKDKLISSLAVMEREGKIKLWNDNEIRPGDEGRNIIFRNLTKSDLMLYLVSAASLDSENCNKELAEALNVDIRVIPIILERCDWLNHHLSTFTVLPDKGMPITEWVPKSKGWQSVVEGIQKTVDKMQAQVDLPSGPSEKKLHAELAFQQGNSLIMLGQVNKAIERYSHAIELNSSDADPYTNRGVAYYSKGEIDLAIEDFDKAIALKPGSAIAYNNRGAAYFIKREYDRAIEDYNTAMQLNPDYAGVYYNRGAVWLRLKEWEKAKVDLSTAKKMGMDIVAAFRNEYRNASAFERTNGVKLPEDIAALVRKGFRNRYPRTQKVLTADGKSITYPAMLNLVETLRNAGPPLGEYIKEAPYFGIKTAPTEVFVVDRGTRDGLIAAHSSSADILKPLLHGRALKRWWVEEPEQWLIFTYRGIEIDAYPAIRNHLEKHREPLSKRKGKGEWYELRAPLDMPKRFAQPKLICPNLYNTQTFAVETDGVYCGDTCCIIPTEETWLCGLLNTRIVEWCYSRISKQLGEGELQAHIGFIKQIPIPDIDATQKDLVRKLVDYLIYLRQQPTTNSKDLAHARDFVMLKYFEWIIDGLFYEFYMPDLVQKADRDVFKHLMAEQLPEVDEIRGDKMDAFRALYEQLYHRKHPVRVNLFFQDSLGPIRIIEDK